MHFYLNWNSKANHLKIGFMLSQVEASNKHKYISKVTYDHYHMMIYFTHYFYKF